MTNTNERILTRDFALLCAAGGTFFASFQLLIAVLPLYIRDIGGSESQIGLIIGFFALAALFPRPFIGREIDRGGSKRFMLAGASTFILASFLYLVASNVPILLGVRLIHGLGMALFTTAAFAVVAELAPPARRGEAMGIWGIVPPFASASAPILGLAIRNRWGDDVVFLCSAAMAISALVLVSMVREPTIERDVHAAMGSLIEKSVLLPSLLVISMTWVFGAVSSFVLLFAEERSITNAGFYFTVSAGAVFLSRLFGGKLSDQYGRWAVIIPSLGGMAAGLAILSQSGSLVVLLTGAAVLGFAFGSGYPALSALAVDVAPPARRGAAMGTFSAAFEVGIGVGAIGMGVVAGLVGYSSMFLIGSTFPVAGMALAYILWNRTRSASA